MNSTADPEYTTSFDGLKWLIVVGLIVAGVAGNWYLGEESVLYRALGLIGLGTVAMAIAAQTNQGRAIWSLMRESRIEIRRVVWPTRDETLQTTLVVIVLLLVFGFVLWLLDTLLTWAIASIIG